MEEERRKFEEQQAEMERWKKEEQTRRAQEERRRIELEQRLEAGMKKLVNWRDQNLAFRKKLQVKKRFENIFQSNELVRRKEQSEKKLL